jgi:hypothetical protein
MLSIAIDLDLGGEGGRFRLELRAAGQRVCHSGAGKTSDVLAAIAAKQRTDARERKKGAGGADRGADRLPAVGGPPSRAAP